MSNSTDLTFDTSIAFTARNGERYLVGISKTSDVLHYAANPNNQIREGEHVRNFQRIWTVCGQVAFNADVYGSGFYTAEEEERFSQDGWDDLYTGTICKSCVKRSTK